MRKPGLLDPKNKLKNQDILA
ncbi:hypothetical protein XBFFL1_2020002 [Xenorhabdus bovienii str. feltiae Florida]|nr:hypothetical protein XBFFL1_2020002 [Xenorhabdus bovienii str. feltiae Florida]